MATATTITTTPPAAKAGAAKSSTTRAKSAPEATPAADKAPAVLRYSIMSGNKTLATAGDVVFAALIIQLERDQGRNADIFDNQTGHKL